MKTDHSSAPAMVDPPAQHPEYHPCTGCHRRVGNAPVAVNHETGRVYWKGVDVNVTLAEYRVIAMMVRANGEYVSYRILYDELKQMPGFVAGQGTKGFENGHHTNMRSCIKRIRKKFMRVDPTWDCIQNFQGFGYAWRSN